MCCPRTVPTCKRQVPDRDAPACTSTARASGASTLPASSRATSNASSSFARTRRRGSGVCWRRESHDRGRSRSHKGHEVTASLSAAARACLDAASPDDKVAATFAAAEAFARGELAIDDDRSEEHTSELQSLMRISYAVLCLNKKNNNNQEDKDKVVDD